MRARVAPLPHKSRSSAELGPIWKTSGLNEVVQNRPVDNKANFYGSDKCVIMCSGAFQILSQSINYGANFIPVLTYLHGNIRFGVERLMLAVGGGPEVVGGY